MTTGVVLLNFGEPAEPDREVVLGYLERIFLANARLEGAETEKQKRHRARHLAEQRVSGLLEEYTEIGGSPLIDQAKKQADTLETELISRGYESSTYVGMQYTAPFIEDAVEDARNDGVKHLVGLPVYPLCGPSTTVQSLNDLGGSIDAVDWDVPVNEVTGWHKHPVYNRLRVDNIRQFNQERGIDISDAETTVVFSAHGTPQHYIEEGSRYEEYVEEYCEVIAAMLGVTDYRLGYQNHENRDIPWTEPAIEEVITSLDTETVVVEPVSFMHEQSETLSELDIDLRQEATSAGIEFHRVPVPFDDKRFATVLANLVEPFIVDIDPEYYNLEPCTCRDQSGTVCLNASRNRSIEKRAPLTEGSTTE